MTKLSAQGSYVPTWDTFVGHKNEVTTLLKIKDAASKRNEPLRPILLWGPGGCGKTTLARLVTDGGQDNIIELNGAAVEDVALAKAVFTLKKKRGALLINEIHTLGKKEQEILYPIMDSGVLSWMGASIDAHISIIGTTTELAALTLPLQSRFSVSLYIGTYSTIEIKSIIKDAAQKHGLEYQDAGADILAPLARGVPRIAIALLEMAKDFSDRLDADTARCATLALGFDEYGLTAAEKAYMIVLFSVNGRASLTAMSSLMCLRSDSVRTIEGHLLKAGFVAMTPGGRVLTIKGWDYVEKTGEGASS